MHTKQAGALLKRCRKIVSVGRVKWIADSPHTGKDNACWYLFTNADKPQTEFYGPPPDDFNAAEVRLSDLLDHENVI